MPLNRHSSTKAVFVGSFDPFHDGHRNIAVRALALVDELVIGVGVNPAKNYLYTTKERVEKIEEMFHDEPRITVEAYSDLTIDFARRHDALYIIKGVRNADDFLYEQKQALWNKQHGQMETLLLLADDEFQDLSSTKIREQMEARQH